MSSAELMRGWARGRRYRPAAADAAVGSVGVEMTASMARWKPLQIVVLGAMLCTMGQHWALAEEATSPRALGIWGGGRDWDPAHPLPAQFRSHAGGEHAVSRPTGTTGRYKSAKSKRGQGQDHAALAPCKFKRPPSSVPASGHGIADINLVFVKNPKCGSTTTAALARRIAWRYGLNGYDASPEAHRWISTEPGVWASHTEFRRLVRPLTALSRPSFLFSVVRDPAARCLSEFYHFAVLQHGVEPTAENKITKLRDCRSSIRQYLLPREAPRRCAPEKLLDYYDFVGNIDRAADTYLLLKNMLQLNMVDILYFAAKNHTADKADATHQALHQEPEAVRAFVEHEFQRLAAHEYELVKAVNERMDARIAEIPDWAEQTREYERLLDVAHTECPTNMPCSYDASTAVKHRCYAHENCLRRALGRDYQNPLHQLKRPKARAP